MDVLRDVTKKEWSKREIEHYQRILYRGEVKKSKFSQVVHAINYVLILGVLILGNLALAFVLLPLFVIADELFTSFFLIMFGIMFGLFSDTIIYHIDQPSDKYYAVVAGFLPLIIIGTFLIASFGGNFWASVLQLPQGIHNPVFVSVVYSVSYALPFFYHVYKRYFDSTKSL